MKFLLVLALMTSMSTDLLAETPNPKYFANDKVQRLAPLAFALQIEASAFHKASKEISIKERQALVHLINSNPELKNNILGFKDLDWTKKEEVLREVFLKEVQSLNIKAPILIIDSKTIKGQAYFDFDINNPTPGTVILNPEELAKDSNALAPLLLLIHETRHSAQFQMAFLNGDSHNPIAASYKAAFIAQKEHAKEIVSFCDFLTLVNEYEAFQFGNYVVSSLFNGNADTLGMGTYAGQYHPDMTLKIDLEEIFKRYESGENKRSILSIFNDLERAQYEILTKQ